MFHLVHGGLDQSGLFQGGVDLANFFLRKTYPETKPLKIDHWKRRFLLETTISRGELLVFRERNPLCVFESTDLDVMKQVILPVGID